MSFVRKKYVRVATYVTHMHLRYLHILQGCKYHSSFKGRVRKLFFSFMMSYFFVNQVSFHWKGM